MNYRLDNPHRSEVLALLRWHRPEGATAPEDSLQDEQQLPGIFTDNPPDQMYSASGLCVVCLEEPSSIAMIPCGHICLCMKCVRTTLCRGRCPVDRCEVNGLYRLKGEQMKIHEAMCDVAQTPGGPRYGGTEMAC